MVTLQLLKMEDATALLEFELVNQEWFESYVEARDEDFFTEEGMNDHIDFYLSEYEQDRIYPMLIKDVHGTICGRANLYNIDREKASGFIGYRIGEQFVSQGFATYATEVLINVARETLALNQLIATAATDNLASQRVLSKNGFKQVGFKPEFTIVDGEIIDCYEYRCVIKQLSSVV